MQAAYDESPFKRIPHHLPKLYCSLIHMRDSYRKAFPEFLLEKTEPEDALQQLTDIYPMGADWATQKQISCCIGPVSLYRAAAPNTHPHSHPHTTCQP